MTVVVHSSPSLIELTNTASNKSYARDFGHSPAIHSDIVSYDSVMKSRRKDFLMEQLESLGKKIEDLSQWEDNWDGHGSKKPKVSSLRKAIRFLTRIFNLSYYQGLLLSQPSISTDEEGDIVCEWWSGTKKLTVDISMNSTEYTKITDLDQIPKFEMGEIDNSYQEKEIYSLSIWLME